MLPWLGVLAGVFLVLYGTFLGTEGQAYRWMRRYGVIFYFGFTYLCMLIASGTLWRLSRSGTIALPARLDRLLVALCLATLAIGLVKCALAFAGDWTRRVVPRAALLGSIAGVAILLIAFLPTLKLLRDPLVGLVALVVLLLAFFGRVRMPFGVPGALAAVAGHGHLLDAAWLDGSGSALPVGALLRRALPTLAGWTPSTRCPLLSVRCPSRSSRPSAASTTRRARRPPATSTARATSCSRRRRPRWWRASAAGSCRTRPTSATPPTRRWALAPATRSPPAS